MSVEPGTYDIVVLVHKNENFRGIPVQKNVVINEDEDHYIDIK